VPNAFRRLAPVADRELLFVIAAVVFMLVGWLDRSAAEGDQDVL
jgi:hypothetical protein